MLLKKIFLIWFQLWFAIILTAQEKDTIVLNQTYGLDEEYIFSLDKMENGKWPSILGNEFIVNGKKYSIAITDFNKNNIFGDIPNDYIHLTPFRASLVPQFPSISNNVINFKDSLVVKLDDSFYQLFFLDKNTPPSVVLKELLPDEYDLTGIDILCHSGTPFYELEDIITKRNYPFESLKSNFVVYYFWGTWCEGCRQVIPKIKELAEDREDIQFVFFNWEDSKEKAIKYINKENLLFANHYLATEIIKKNFAVNAFPTFVIYHNNKYVARFNFIDNFIKFFKK